MATEEEDCRNFNEHVKEKGYSLIQHLRLMVNGEFDPGLQREDWADFYDNLTTTLSGNVPEDIYHLGIKIPISKRGNGLLQIGNHRGITSIVTVGNLMEHLILLVAGP